MIVGLEGILTRGGREFERRACVKRFAHVDLQEQRMCMRRGSEDVEKPIEKQWWLAGNVLSFSTSRHGDSTATNEGVNKNVESTYGLAVERGFLGAGTSHRIRGPYLN